MLTLTSGQLEGLIALFLFPFVRILAWLSFDPLLGNRSAPVTVRVALAFVLAVAIAPVLPPPVPAALASGDGFLILLQQIAVGAALGFTLRILFAAVELAGQFMGLQMGLSFATLFDPVNGAQTPVVAQFLVLSTSLILFAFNGHHLVIGALVQSFTDIPVSASLGGKGFGTLVVWSGTLFSTGLHIALPVTAALLATNLAIGMMTRASPQLNIFAVGFPLTLGAGFLVLYLTLQYLPGSLDQLLLETLRAATAVMRGVAGQ
ncbi:MAG TPA: flagellar biosynthetic protein FliR [Thiobacillaceae bacterium]|nr:flagellar biosynthetic protein FliR [Thiobacillaceae bacterium]HNF88693.1 flagellar biosynthetic protein FliR [Thiobacillaceae bacterium]HNH89483.1 flagellar biosynthetic protein FliR [Thiobacillaceae bacterium]